jgi:hypothetical protein
MNLSSPATVKPVAPTLSLYAPFPSSTMKQSISGHTHSVPCSSRSPSSASPQRPMPHSLQPPTLDILAVSIYYLGCINCFILSTSFHTLNSQSALWHSLCLSFDHIGIVLVIYGSTLPATHFLIHCPSQYPSPNRSHSSLHHLHHPGHRRYSQTHLSQPCLPQTPHQSIHHARPKRLSANNPRHLPLLLSSPPGSDGFIPLPWVGHPQLYRCSNIRCSGSGTVVS